MRFQVGFAEDVNRRHRRTMEDAHVIETELEGNSTQSFFAIYDGHAGKQSADWCSTNLHKLFMDIRRAKPRQHVLEALNEAFQSTTDHLSKLPGFQSGCTSIVAYIQSEQQSNDNDNRQALYTANVGDARAILCRNRKAIRLSYDHKGSDPQEIRRIIESGGFIMNNRVNGVLAVTRALGDCYMKDLVLSSPYTTETSINETDEFLILACDGLWDIATDQQVVDLVYSMTDAQQAAELLVKHALENDSRDNLSCMVYMYFQLPNQKNLEKSFLNLSQIYLKKKCHLRRQMVLLKRRPL